MSDAPLHDNGNLWEREEIEWDREADAEPGEQPAARDSPETRDERIERLAQQRATQHEIEQRSREIAHERALAKRSPEAAAPIDWQAFLTEKIQQPPFFTGKVMAEGHHVAMIGDGKAGKSLLVLDMAYRISAGQAFLGDGPRQRRRILYIDQENGRYDIQSRMLALGAKPGQLDDLIYMSFPSFRPLDTPAGAADLIAEVDRHRPRLVILDTISRMIEGKENDSDPWRDMYRLFIIEMKRRECSTMRLDHFGKDKDKGGRGSSAKDQDVDAVWELRAVEKGGNRLTLTRTHTRNGIGPGVFSIERQGEMVADQWRPGATRHVLLDGADRAGEFIVAGTIADQLDAAGIPMDLGRDKVRAILKEKHPDIRCNNDVLGAAITLRRERVGNGDVTALKTTNLDLDEAA